MGRSSDRYRSEHEVNHCPMFPERPRAWWVNYAATVALIAAMSAFTVLTQPYLPEAFYRVPYVLVIGTAGYLFGTRPAILALVLGLGSYMYIQIPPQYAFLTPDLFPMEWAEIVVFVVGGAAAGIGGAVIRENKSRIQRLANYLAESEAVLDAFFTESPAMLLILDNDLNILMINSLAARVIGLPVEEIIGTPVQELMPHISDIVPHFRKVLDTGESEINLQFGAEIPPGSGVTKHWLSSHFPIVTEDGTTIGLGVFSIDITDRVHAEEELKRSEARFRTTFDTAGIGMTIINVQGFVLAANPAFAAFVGYPHSDLIGMNVETYAYPEDAIAANDLLFEMLGGKRESFQSEKRYVKKDGSIVWGRLTASIARGPAFEEPFIIGMIEDITDRIRAEESLRFEQEYRLEFLRRTIMSATDGKLMITDRDGIEALYGEVLDTREVTEADELKEIRHMVGAIAQRIGIDESRASQFTMALGEALTNALKHAGEGTLTVRLRENSLLVVVDDSGPGIQALSLPAVALQRGYSTAGTLGMGFKVMIAFSDRVYLSTSPDGTTVGIELLLETAVLDPWMRSEQLNRQAD